MTKRTFTDDDFSTLANALESAANRYEECAKALSIVPGHQRLVEQFERQRDEAKHWAARFMAASSGTLEYDAEADEAPEPTPADREAYFFGGPAS